MSSVSIVNRISACEYCVPQEFTKAAAAIGVPERVSVTDIYFRKATFIGKRSARANNVGTIYLGMSNVNDTQSYEIGAGLPVTVIAPVGVKFSLRDFWIDAATATDGVMVIYS